MDKKQPSITFDKPFLVIAHRGASKQAPENTLAAFQKAIDAGADMIELDVQLSSDNVPVVFHDSDLDKHSNGYGLLSGFSVENLRKLDAGSWFSGDFEGEKIPLLTEVLELVKDRVLLNIEIKPEAVSQDAESGIEYKVCELAGLFGIEKEVIISSFDYRVLSRINQLNPEIRTGLLYNRELSGSLSPSQLVKTYGAYSFHCSRWQVRRKWIAECKRAGVPVYVYTVNGRRTMRSLIKKGVSGIFSDRPARLKRVSDRILKGR